MRNRTVRALAIGIALAAIPATIASAEAVRELVSSSPAQGAPGYVLNMYKVTIPKGTTLPLHYHPGTQLVRVQQGDLTYTVERGTAYLSIPRAGMDPKKIPIRPGQTRVVHPGQGVVEPAGMRHFASAPTSTVILVVSILKPKASAGTINVAP
jgi:quercetin dioxygenase-like cupin family protein